MQHKLVWSVILVSSEKNIQWYYQLQNWNQYLVQVLREGSGRVDECYQRDLMADVYLPCCTKDEEHSMYYYYFGAYKAFCRNKVEKHKNKAQTFSTANTEIEQKTLESFDTWNKDKDGLIKYKLVHSN